jgi:hypothetical protein
MMTLAFMYTGMRAASFVTFCASLVKTWPSP